MTSLKIGTSGSYSWYLDYTLTQDIAANQSTIAYTLRIHKDAGSGAFWGTPARTFTVTVDGTADAEGFTSVSFSGVSDINFNTGSKTITHDADGTHSPVSVSAGVTGAYVTSSFPVPTSVGSKTITLPPIPRAATSVTRSGSTETGSATTLTLSPSVDSFYYVLKYKSPATGTWTLIGASGGIVGTSWPYSTTVGHGEIPNATSGTIQFQVTTLDSSGGTQIGSPVEVGFTYTVPTSVVPAAGTPTWTEGATTTGLGTLTNSGAVFAQGWSKLIPTFSSSAGTGASVTSATAAVVGVSGTTTSGVAFANPVTTQGSAATFDVTVTDSRGRTDHNTGTVSPSVHRWVMPLANAGSAVVTPTSTTQTIALSGLQAVTSSFYLSGSQRNILQTRTGYRDVTASGSWTYGSWTTQSVSPSDATDNVYAPGTALTVATGLNPLHEYEISLQVRDIFGSNSVNYSTGAPYVESVLSVPAQNVLMSFVDNTAVGFGKIPVIGMVDSAGDIHTDTDMLVDGDAVVDGTITQGGNAVIDTSDVATTSTAGIAPFATGAETITGTEAGKAVTPAGLDAAYGTRISDAEAAIAKLEDDSGWVTFSAAVFSSATVVGSTHSFASLPYATVVELQFMGVADPNGAPSARTFIANFVTTGTGTTLYESVQETITTQSGSAKGSLMQLSTLSIPASTSATAKLQITPNTTARIAAGAWRWRRVAA